MVNALVGNWQANAIEHITSGFPLFMVASANTSGVNFSGTGVASIAPTEAAAGGSVTGPSRSLSKLLYRRATGPAWKRRSHAALGPGFVNTDFSAVKKLPLRFREGTSLEFRAEFFNLFNTPQFFQPGTDIDSPGFGQITGTVNNPRLIQFALKLLF